MGEDQPFSSRVKALSLSFWKGASVNPLEFLAGSTHALYKRFFPAPAFAPPFAPRPPAGIVGMA